MAKDKAGKVLTIMDDDGYTYLSTGECLGRTPESQKRPERKSMLWTLESDGDQAKASMKALEEEYEDGDEG